MLVAPIEAPQPPAGAPVAAPALEVLVERLLRRVAIGGSRHRGTAVLEVGAGPLQGATITITADGPSLHVEVDAPDTPAILAWKKELEARLQPLRGSRAMNEGREGAPMRGLNG